MKKKFSEQYLNVCLCGKFFAGERVLTNRATFDSYRSIEISFRRQSCRRTPSPPCIRRGAYSDVAFLRGCSKFNACEKVGLFALEKIAPVGLSISR